MFFWFVAFGVGVAFAFVQYWWRPSNRGLAPIIAALLRIGAVTLAVALLLDAPAGQAPPMRAWAALDASESMIRGDSMLFRDARDSLGRAGAESTFVFGDSVRVAGSSGVEGARDRRSLLRGVADRAVAAGHPLTVITDGELDDADAVASLPGGSRILVLPRREAIDVAIAALDGPRAVVSGDTAVVRVTLASGGAKVPAAGTVRLFLDGREIAAAQVDAVAPHGERQIEIPAVIGGPPGAAVLTAIVRTAGDTEARNDTLSFAVDRSRAASAVFVSTSPDFDARNALAVLRGALAIPTRGFFRVAPNTWRLDGPLTAVTETEVREALRTAPVGIIHGDTMVFGPPRGVTAGPVALVVPPSEADGEWYAAGAPPSPLSPSLAGLPWDSLPPVALSGAEPKGSWKALEVRRGRESERRAIIVGTESPRRVVTVAAGGLWRWRFRGGAAADAYAAVWGSIFDWLAAERADARAAVPDAGYFRGGEPIRWRRGSAADTAVTITLRARNDPARVDTVMLPFGSGATVIQSPARMPGVYDVSTRGGSSLLVVNGSREWLPRLATVKGGDRGARGSVGAGPRLRTFSWAYVAIVVLLCAEWVIRRRAGMR